MGHYTSNIVTILLNSIAENQSRIKKETYIKRSERDLACKLAQKDYAIKLIKQANKCKKELLKNTVTYSRDDIIYFHKNLSTERQSLITPFIISDEKYREMWMMHKRKESATSSPYPLDLDSGLTTEKGEIVRSKSEKIIADKLYMMGIPYIYECPLNLNENNRIYPDFTLINTKTRKEFYWEHFGMMGDPEYSEKAIRKISKYQKSGFLLGKNLIATFETSDHFLTPKEIEEIIQEFLSH